MILSTSTARNLFKLIINKIDLSKNTIYGSTLDPPSKPLLCSAKWTGYRIPGPQAPQQPFAHSQGQVPWP